MKTPPKITLDTNCVINLFDTSSPSATSVGEIKELFRRAVAHEIQLSITTRVEADLLQDKDLERRSIMLQQLDLFPVVGSLVRTNESKTNGPDRLLVDGHHGGLTTELMWILFPGIDPASNKYSNCVRDVDHLYGHHINHGDIFVTDDKRLVKRGEAVKAATGIVVMSPAQCLHHLDSTAGSVSSTPAEGNPPERALRDEFNALRRAIKYCQLVNDLPVELHRLRAFLVRSGAVELPAVQAFFNRWLCTPPILEGIRVVNLFDHDELLQMDLELRALEL